MQRCGFVRKRMVSWYTKKNICVCMFSDEDDTDEFWSDNTRNLSSLLYQSC